MLDLFYKGLALMISANEPKKKRQNVMHSRILHVHACVCFRQEQGPYARKHSNNRHNVGNQCLGRPRCKLKCGLTKSHAYIKGEEEYPSPVPPPTIYKVTYGPQLHAQLPDL